MAFGKKTPEQIAENQARRTAADAEKLERKQAERAEEELRAYLASPAARARSAFDRVAMIRGWPSISGWSMIWTSPRPTMRQPTQALGGEAPVEEVIACIHVAWTVNLDRRGIARQVRAVGLEQDFAARHQHVGEGL
jgi:hypothetical protein